MVLSIAKRICEGRSSWPTALMLWLLPLPLASAGTVSTLDDIQFWVGSGANRAAVAIDWDDTSAADESLVWGYRWDGTATGEDMLLTVLESDDRLFAKLSAPGPAGVAPYGLGYDLNDDGLFAITDNTTFNADGVAISGPADGATSIDSNDLYAEGWFSGFWHYSLSSGNPFDGGSWSSNGGGMSSRMLSDGDWDSWTFTPTFDFTAFAENPRAAEAPLVADFDSDNDVDGADFLAWQRGFGIASGATLPQGDANGDQAVNAMDLQLWSANFSSGPFGSGTAGGALQSIVLVVPEPPCIVGALWVFFVLFLGPCHTTRRRI